MWACDNCLSYFEETGGSCDIHCEVDTRDREYYACCPYCGETDIKELHRCQCGEWIQADESYCQSCRDIVVRAVEELAVSCNMDQETVREILADYLEST